MNIFGYFFFIYIHAPYCCLYHSPTHSSSCHGFWPSSLRIVIAQDCMVINPLLFVFLTWCSFLLPLICMLIYLFMHILFVCLYCLIRIILYHIMLLFHQTRKNKYLNSFPLCYSPPPYFTKTVLSTNMHLRIVCLEPGNTLLAPKRRQICINLH